jgi:hypothetical protein
MSSSSFWLKPCSSFSFRANSGRRSHSDKERRPTRAAFLPGTFRSAPGFHGVAGPELNQENFQNGRFCLEHRIGQNIKLDRVPFGLLVPSVFVPRGRAALF